MAKFIIPLAFRVNGGWRAFSVVGPLRNRSEVNKEIRCRRRLDGTANFLVFDGELVIADKVASEASSEEESQPTRLCGLTGRESQVARLIAAGLKNKEIAGTLGLSEGTVKVYASHIFRKTGVQDRMNLGLRVSRFEYQPAAEVPQAL